MPRNEGRAIKIEQALDEGWFIPNRNGGLCECNCGEAAPISTRTCRRDGIFKGEPAHFVHTHGTALAAKNKTPEWIANIAEAQKGSRRSEETKAKMRKAATTRKGVETPGRFLSNGYVQILVHEDHPFVSMARRNGRGEHTSLHIPEHRLVMAEHLGRALTSKETVHHLTVDEGGSGDTSDNRLENLRLFPSNSAHQSHHAALRGQRKRLLKLVEAWTALNVAGT